MSDRTMGVFSGFPAVQMVLLTVLLMIKLYLAPSFDALYGVACAFVVVFLVADVMLFVTLDRYEKGRAERERAQLLEMQLDAYLTQYESVLTQVESVAHMRHDLRNQVQVIETLVERGDAQRASEHVASLIERTQVKEPLEREVGQ